MTTRLNRRRMDADDSLGADPLTRAPRFALPFREPPIFQQENNRSNSSLVRRTRGRERERVREGTFTFVRRGSEREISNGRWNSSCLSSPSHHETRSEIDIYGLPGMLKRTTPAFRRGLLRRRLRIETNCQLFSYLTGVTGILSFRRNVTWPPSPASFYQPRAIAKRKAFSHRRLCISAWPSTARDP